MEIGCYLLISFALFTYVCMLIFSMFFEYWLKFRKINKSGVEWVIYRTVVALVGTVIFTFIYYCYGGLFYGLFDGVLLVGIIVICFILLNVIEVIFMLILNNYDYEKFCNCDVSYFLMSIALFGLLLLTYE